MSHWWSGCSHLLPIFNWIDCLTDLWESFIYSEYGPFIRYVSQIFSPSVWLAFSLYNTVFWRAKVLHFGQIQFINFEMIWAFCVLWKKQRSFALCFFLDVLWFELIHLICDPFWVNFCVFCKVRVAVHPFVCGCPVVPELFVENSVFPLWITLASLSKLCFWTLCSTLHTYPPLPGPCYLDAFYIKSLH